jgi:oxaloacetate decarboxylase alpha subunit
MKKPISGRYAETLQPEFEKAKSALAGVALSDEDVLSYLLFPQIAEKFFKAREEAKINRVTYSIRKI